MSLIFRERHTVTIKQIGSEFSIWFKQVFHIRNSWILLPGILAVVMVYAVHYFNIYPWLATKAFHEDCAPWLVLAIFVVLLIKSLSSRNPLVIFLAVLALVFLVRELDHTVFTVFGEEYLFKSKRLLGFLLVAMGLWALGWHEKLFACLNSSILLKVSLAGVFWTYLFSQRIARRVFRDILPEERLLHVPLEEIVETASHLFFLAFAVFCLFYFRTRETAQVQRIPPAVDAGETAGQ